MTAEGFEPKPEAEPPLPTPAAVEAADAPIAIDLPDGQRLLVGELPAGTAVEIATWKGIGRPGPDTHRLLLGVTRSAEVNLSPTAQAVADQRWRDLLDPAQPAEPKPAIATKPLKVRRYHWRGWMSALLIAALIALAALYGVRLVHPRTGLATSVSTAESSVAVTVPIGMVNEGDVLILVSEQGPVLGSAVSIYGESVLVATGGGFAQASVYDIYGRVLFVVPFIGSVLSFFGL